jgi:tetratricopeptide (TPR) repeat protein
MRYLRWVFAILAVCVALAISPVGAQTIAEQASRMTVDQRYDRCSLSVKGSNWRDAVEWCTAALNEYARMNTNRQINSYIFRARAHGELSNFKAAAEDYSRLLDILNRTRRAGQPDAVDLAALHHERGRMYLSLFNFEAAALDYCEAARRRLTTEAWERCGLAQSLAGKPDRSAEAYSQALSRDPLNLKILRFRASEYRKAGKWDLAIADHDQAIRRAPADPEGYNERAATYLAMKDSSRALQDFDGVLRLKPSPDAWYQRGKAYAQMANYDQAIQDYNAAIKLAPHNGVFFKARGLAYQAKREFVSALNDFKEFSRLRPKDAEGPLLRGLLYHEMGDKNRAYQELDAAQRLAPDRADIRNLRNDMQVLGELGKVFDPATGQMRPTPPSAKTARNSAPSATAATTRLAPPAARASAATPVAAAPVVAAPPNPNAGPAAEHFTKGRNAWTQYNYDVAIPSFREAVRLAPENAEYQHQLGFALHVVGQVAEGIPHLQKATELAPRSWEYLMHLGDALTSVGQTDGALQAIDKALAIVPGNPYVLGARKRALAKAGRRQ